MGFLWFGKKKKEVVKPLKKFPYSAFKVRDAKFKTQSRLRELCINCAHYQTTSIDHYKHSAKCPLGRDFTEQDIVWLESFTGQKCTEFRRKF